MSQYANACFLAGALLNFRRDHRTDSAEPSFAVLLLRTAGDKICPLRPSPFGHHNQREVFSIAFAFGDVGTNAFVAEGNFGNYNHIAATSNAGMRRDPAGVAAHYF